MKEKASPDVLDAALIGAAQKVEHYEIAAYGTLRTYAQLAASRTTRATSTPRFRKRATPTKLSRAWPA